MNNSDVNKNVNSESDLLDNSWGNPVSEPNYFVNEQKINCYEWITIVVCSYRLLILMGLILILLSLCIIPSYKKFKDTNRNYQIFCLPLLNIYSLFKITIGKIRFYYIIVYLLFLGCILVYNHVNYHSCYDVEILWYILLVGGLFSIIILFILGIELASLYKKDSDKESSDKIE